MLGYLIDMDGVIYREKDLPEARAIACRRGNANKPPDNTRRTCPFATISAKSSSLLNLAPLKTTTSAFRTSRTGPFNSFAACNPSATRFIPKGASALERSQFDAAIASLIWTDARHCRTELT